MILKENIHDKFGELITSANTLKAGNEYGHIRSPQHEQACIAWLASAQNLADLVLGTSPNPYKTSIDKICSIRHGVLINKSVGSVATILESLLADIVKGLISSIENQTTAIVFDDFLDHARKFFKQGSVRESGVISSVVFEDTLRTISRNSGIKEKGKQLDTVIADLSKIGILSKIKAKRARVAADVRNKATHAQWDDFDMSDVKTTIEFTEELISGNLHPLA